MSGPSRLRVLRLAGDGDGWEDVVTVAAALAGAGEVVDEPVGRGATGADGVLAAAAAGTDPILVLPARPPPPPGPDRAAAVRLVVPIDRSSEEREVLDAWVERAVAAGVRVRMVHALTDRTRPAMWEGAGHHAEAWWAELRRSQGGDGVEVLVRSGEPAERIADVTSVADLLLVAWSGSTEAGRCAVVRALLGGGRSPLLLIRAGDTGAGQPA